MNHAGSLLEHVMCLLQQAVGDIAIKMVQIALRPHSWLAVINGHLPKHMWSVAVLAIHKV